MVLGQTVIIPLKGVGQTDTVVTQQGPLTQIHAGTLKNGNAYSTYSAFQVGAGDTARLNVPQGINWWVNIVKDSRVRVDGLLESRLRDGSIGGNILFVDSHGLTVGPAGQIDVGRLVFAAPSTAYVDRLLGADDPWNGAAISPLLAGQFERSATGSVDIQGRIHARDGISLMAGAGQDADRAVRISGQLVVDGRVAGAAVNLGDLKSLAPLEDRDGVIDITTPGSIRLDGVLISDGSHWRQPGAVRVLAGQDIELGKQALVSASGGTGTGQAGGQVSLYAQQDIRNEPGARLSAHGDGQGQGGWIEYSSTRNLLQDNLRFDAASDLGLGGAIYLDPDNAVVDSLSSGLLTNGASYNLSATYSITVKNGAVINTRKVAAGDSATSLSALSTGNSGSISLTAPAITIESGATLDASVINATGASPTTYTAGNITFNAKAWRLLLDGLIEPDSVIQVGGLLRGKDISMDAKKSITIQTGAMINTRQVGSGDDATSSSTLSIGNSGKITLKAPSITVESGSTLDASVLNSTGATPSTFTAGDITLSATDTSNWVFLLGFANANASIDVAGTLKGQNITLESSIESSAVYDGVSAALTQKALELALDALNSPINFSLAYTEAKGNATVTLKPTAVLKATQDVTLNALADRTAGAELQAEGSAKANLSAGFSRALGTTKMDIQSGASVTAAGDIGVTSASKTAISMVASASGETNSSGEANVASVVFAGSMTDVSTQLNVGSNAVLTSTGGNIALQAFHGGSYETEAEVTVYGKGTAGVVGALSLQKSSTEVNMAGQLTAQGDVSVTSLHATARNTISAKTAVSSAPSPSLPIPESLDYSSEEGRAALLVGFITFAQSVYDLSQKSSSSSSSSSSSGSKVKLAGAVAWSEADHTTRTVITGSAAGAPNAQIQADGNVVIDAQTLIGAMRTEAGSEATSATKGADGSKLALSAAFSWSDYAYTTQAQVGTRATVSGDHVAVHAAVDVPEFYVSSLPDKWGNFYDVYSNLMQGTDAVYAGLNSRVNASAAGTGLAASGAVNLSYLKLDTRATVESGASLTANSTSTDSWTYNIRQVDFDSDVVDVVSPGAPQPYKLDVELSALGDFVDDTRVVLNSSGVATSYKVDEVNFDRSFAATTAVRAENNVQTIHLAGGVASEAGAKGVSVGGTYSLVSRDNTAIAAVGDGVTISSKRLDVSAHTSDWLLTVSPTAGGGAGPAANGMVSYNQLKENTLASISREALVDADTVNVNADLSLWAYGISGAITTSSNSGVGVGVSLNDMTGMTKAYIGDNDVDLLGTDTTEGTRGHVTAKTVNVNANTAGTVGAIAVAASEAGAPDASSNSSSMRTKASNQTADSQQKLGGSLSGLPILAEFGETLMAAGAATKQANSAAENNKPPSLSVAGAGALVTNISNLDTYAQVNGALIQAPADADTRLVVRGFSDLTQITAAGGGALTMARNPSTKFSSAIAGAVAIEQSDDDTTAQVLNTTVTGVADEAGAFQVQALKSGERTAVATGISMNLSASASGLSIVGSVSITHLTDDTQAQVKDSSITGAVAASTLLDPQVVAYDRSRLGAGGGALSMSTGKGSAGIGAAVSLVDLQGTTAASLTTSSVKQAKDLTVAAYANEKVVSLGAVAGIQTAPDSRGQLMGSFVFNELGNTVSAKLSSGSGNQTIDLTGNVLVRAGGRPTSTAVDTLMGSMRSSLLTDFEMASSDNGYSTDLTSAVGAGESILGVAGALSVTLGSNAGSMGISYAQNSIQSTYSATASGTIDADGSFSVIGRGDASIIGISAGAGATKGKFSGMGSATVNAIGQRTQALVTSAHITASSLTVDSGTYGNILGLAGNISLSLGANGTAAGGAVAYNATATKTYTFVDTNTDESGTTTTDTYTTSTRSAGNEAGIVSSTVNVGSGALKVQANQINQTQAAAASAAIAASGNFSFTGTATWNEIGDVTSASVTDSTLTAGTVAVKAGESDGTTTAKIQSLVGGISASSKYAAAMAFGFNKIGSQRSALISGSDITASTSYAVSADAQGSVETLAANLVASSQSTAVGASSTTNWLNASVVADVENSDFRGAASSLTVHAQYSGKIHSLAGTISGSVQNAVGGSVAVNLMGEGSEVFEVKALANGAALHGASSLLMDASLSGEIKSFAVAGGGSGSNAINGSATTNQIEADVKATASNVQQSADASNVRITATQSSNIFSLAGAIGGAGSNAVGAAISVNDIRSNVQSSLSSSTVKATNELKVGSTSSGTIQSIAAAGSAAGGNAVNGSFTTNSITSSVTADMTSVTQSTQSSLVNVRATDGSTIESLAGAVSGGGSAAAGAALALNFLGRTTTNADAEKLVRAQVSSSSLSASGDVTILADSTSTIRSLGAAVGAGGSVAVTGSNTTNYIEDTLLAKMQASSLTGATAGSLTVKASDTATIASLAGNLSGSVGATAVGAALAINRINTDAQAIVGGSGTIRTGDVLVAGVSDATIDTIAVGMSASNTAGVQGSAATSIIGSNTSSLVNAGTHIEAYDTVGVIADSRDRIKSLAGSIGIGVSGVGAAGGVQVNLITSTTSAGIDGASTQVSGAGTVNGMTFYGETLSSAPDLMNITSVSDTALTRPEWSTTTRRGVAVQATSIEQIGALTAVVGGGTGGVGASVNVDTLKGSTRAYVDSAVINGVAGGDAAQGATVMAVDHALIASSATTAAGGLTGGVSGTMAGEVLKRSVTAEVIDSANVKAVGNVAVKAVSDATVAVITAGAGGGGVAGVAGSGDVVLLNSDTLARVDASTVAGKDVAVLSDVGNHTNMIAGSGAVGGAAGVGLSFGVNVSGSRSRALVNNSTLLADGDVSVLANNLTEELAVVATFGAGGNAGVAIAAAVTVIEGDTEARISGTSSAAHRTVASGALPVSANDSGLQLSLVGDNSTVTANEQTATVFRVYRDGTLAGVGSNALLRISDGTRTVDGTLNADGSFTANLSSLGDGTLRAVLYSTAVSGQPSVDSTSSSLNFTKAAGVKSLTVAAHETVSINHNAGGLGLAGGLGAGVGTAANVVIGKSSVAASVSGSSFTVGNALQIKALRDANVDMITATGGGGGLAGISGAVGVLIFGAAPSSDSNKELNTGNSSTLSKVSGATESNKAQGTSSSNGGLTTAEVNSVNSDSSYNTQTAYTGASGAHSTSATLGSGNVLAGSVLVSSLDQTSVSNNAGSVAGGAFGGVSAGVAITQLGGANNAAIAVGTLSTQGNVTVDSGERVTDDTQPTVSSRAVSGSGGFVGVGAAVSVASNETASTASIAGQVYAGGAVSVTARDEATMSSEAYGASVGAVSVGVVVATAEQKGSVGTSASGTLMGVGVSLNAERLGQVNSRAVGGSAGVAAGSGAGATASDSGTVSVSLGNGLIINGQSGDVNISARSYPGATSNAIGVAVASGAAVGVSISEASTSTDVLVSGGTGLSISGANVNINAALGGGNATLSSTAISGGGALLVGATGADARATHGGSSKVNLLSSLTLDTTGDVAIEATGGMNVHSSSTGVAAGFVGIGVALAKSESTNTVETKLLNVQGRVRGSLLVTATGNDTIDSKAVAGAGGVVAGSGAEAAVTDAMTVKSELGLLSTATFLADLSTVISAERKVTYDSQTTTANASAFGGSGAVSTAVITGSATAQLDDGAKLTGGSLQVLASNTIGRSDLTTISAEGGGGGVITGSAADANTRFTGDALASIGNNVQLTLNNLLEVRAYNEMQGSTLGRVDAGGAIPIALVNTRLTATANADANIGQNVSTNVYGETHVDALSYINIEANTISKTYGLAGVAQGNAYATANVNNRVNIGSGTTLRSVLPMSLLAGQDREFNRNHHFVTASADIFNHSAIPVSINPDADATLNLTNSLTVNATAVRSGGTISMGSIEGSYVVEGKGNVSDWTRDVGEVLGISSTYGSSNKTMANTALLNGEFEAGFGNKQKIVFNQLGQVDASQSLGDVRYTITNEDLGASAGAYVARLYDQLARYGDVPEVKAFVQAELSFYFDALIRDGLAEKLQQDGKDVYVAKEGVAANFLNIKDLRAGSGNIELFGSNVKGNAKLIARADSEIYIENNSPLNLRIYNLTVDANGGFAKYNGTYLTKNADIGTLNSTDKTTSLTIDSIDTRGGGSAQQLPKLTVKNNYVADQMTHSSAVMVTAPDGTSADLREDEIRAPEIRINGTVYNKLGTITLTNTAGSISVYAENPAYVPKVDGKEIQITAGKNFMLTSPSISMSVGGAPESLYAVDYSDDQKKIFNNLGISTCGSARPGESSPTYNANCLVNGAGGIYASGAIFMGARYLNINGTVQSGQSDYNVTFTDDVLKAKIDAFTAKYAKIKYLMPEKLQISGPLPSDSESEINKLFANGKISITDRNQAIADIATRRKEPVVFYNTKTKRLTVSAINLQGGLVELVGSVINTGGGVIRALDGYARMNIDNQSTLYPMDVMGLDTGGDKGVVRITDLSKPVKDQFNQDTYQVTTYSRNDSGVYQGITTAGRGYGAPVISTTANTLASPSGNVLARFNYNPLANSSYSWSAGYEYTNEKHYWYSSSSWLGFIPGGSTSWDSIDTYVKTANAMVQDVYVGTTLPVGNKNFSVETKRSVTDAEVQTYYRTWSKCGFLCIKKTYYIDRRTEVGMKDVFTQRVRADNAINVELIGYSTGSITLSSKMGIRLGGNILNDNGNVSITSSLGSISLMKGGVTVQGLGLNFQAKTGIGSMDLPVNLVTGATGNFTAVSTSGDVAFHGNSGALRINSVSTSGNVWLDGDESILSMNSGVAIQGNRIYLSAPRGSIGEFNADGTVKSLVKIQTSNSPNGGLTAYSRNGIAISQPTGNLWVNQVATGGDVYLAAGGDLIDNNRNETRDVRTEEQLLALWDSAALQGTSAEASRLQTIALTRTQYRRYWDLRNVRSVVKDGSGNVTNYVADTITDSYQFHYSDEEKTAMLDSGMDAGTIAANEAARTAEVKQLNTVFGKTVYQEDNDRIIAAINTANALDGKGAVGAMATWSDTELKNPLPKAVFSKSSSSTQTRIEEPNVVGNRVVLLPGGKIGKDDGSILIPLRQSDRIARGMSAELTEDERLAIMAAESTDMTLDRTNWTLTVLKKDTFDVLSNRLNLTSNGFVYLGANATTTYPNGGSANIERVIGTGEIRIKVTDSIVSVADAGVTVLQGQKAILEAAQGTIGTADKPLQISLASGGTLTARGNQGIWLHEIGNLLAADIYSPNAINLSATLGIYDARPVINYPEAGDKTVRAIEGQEISLTAQGGPIGESSNPLVIKVGDGGVNAFTPRNSSVYLTGAEGGGAMTVHNIMSGKDVTLVSAFGGVTNIGAITATGQINVDAEGAVTGVSYSAGDSVLIAAVGEISGVMAQAGAAGSVNLNTNGGGRVAFTTLSAGRDISATAGGLIDITSASAGRDLALYAQGTISGVSLSANNAAIIRAYGSTSDLSITTASAKNSTLTMTAGRDASVTLSSAGSALSLTAGRDANLLNVTSSLSTVDIVSSGLVSMLSGTSRGRLRIQAATGIQANALNSSQADMLLETSAGSTAVQSASSLNQLVIQNGVDISLGSVRSTSSSVTLSGSRDISLNSAQANTDVAITAGRNASVGNLTASNGAVTVSGVSISGGNLSSKNDLTVTATGDVSLGGMTSRAALFASASGQFSAMALTASGQINVSSGLAMSLSSARTTVAGVSLTSLGDLSTGAVSAVDKVAVTAAGALTMASATSSADGVDILSTAGALSIGTANAKGALTLTTRSGDLSAGTVLAQSAVLTAAGDLGVSKSAFITDNFTATATGAANLLRITTTAGTVKVDAGQTLQVGTVVSNLGVDLSAATGMVTGSLSAGTLVDVDTVSGNLTMTGATSRTLMDIQAGGDINVGTVTALGSGAQMVSGGRLQVKTLNAVNDITLTAGGSAALSTIASSAGALTVNAGDMLQLTTGRALLDVSVSGTNGLTTATLSSTNGAVSAQSSAGGVTLNTATAKTSFAAMSGGTLSVNNFSVSSGMANLMSGSSQVIKSGSASGGITTRSSGALTATTVTSTAGLIDMGARELLKVTSASGYAGLILSGTAGVTGSTLMSANGAVNVQAAAGSIVLSSTTAKTALDAASGGSMTLTSFNVLSGGATLQSASSATFKSGTASGDISVTSDGDASLGSLTSLGRIDVQAQRGGIAFSTLRSATGMQLHADRAGSNSQAISGAGLYVTAGALSLLADTGNVSVSALSATANSTVTAKAGNLRISSLVGLSRANLALDVSGTKNLPLTY